MALSTWALSEIKERTIDGVDERYYNCGGVNFCRKFHPDFVGAWSEHRLFFAMDWTIQGDIAVSPTQPGGNGKFSFGLQRDQTASFNTAGTCPLLLGVTGFDPANAMDTGFSTGGLQWIRTTLRRIHIENGVESYGANIAPTHYISLQPVNRTLIIVRYLYDGAKYTMQCLGPITGDGVELDVSQNDMVDLYNTSDWADILTAMAPYGYGQSTTEGAGVVLDEATYGQLNAAYFTFNHRYLNCGLTAVFGKVIP